MRVMVAGGGGFIGGHLVDRLLKEGCSDVRSVDYKPVASWHQAHSEAENRVLDLRRKASCDAACADRDIVFNLACDMGGMGFIELNKAACMESVLISTHLLQAARDAGVERFFFSSSACVYPTTRQDNPGVSPLKEDEAYPALPEDGYGWEKLFSERMCRHFFEDYGLETRVARYHNVYGPFGTWDGGREKVPAAICRKVARAIVAGPKNIEIWGDGEQTRSFTYIDDCIEGTLRLVSSDVRVPINIGSSEMVTINKLVSIVESIEGVTLQRSYNTSAPQGVRGRSSDNCKIRDCLNWEPNTPLEIGMRKTYEWVRIQVESTDARE